MQPPAVPVRVAFCDDAMGFPLLLTTWLEDMPGVSFVGSARNVPGLLELLPEARPDVLLLDVMLPDGRISPELATQVRAAVPSVSIIVMSSLGLGDLAVEAEKIDADGVWSKADGAEALRTLLRSIRSDAPA